jgi:transcriptional regulator with XRE-family HTH domain
MSNYAGPTVNIVDFHVGQRLKIALERANVTPLELAELVGIGSLQLERYCSGQERIGAAVLSDLSLFLNRPIHWFFIDFDKWKTELR